ncbi:MAG: MFS transporter [Bacteroidetes bacterium]|nr:MFS transporter [Bacteroidota bacterium]
MDNSSSRRSLYTLISVFFFWGFVAASNTVLIGIFKKNFDLSQFQAQLVDWAFYTAYFVGSIIYFIISFSSGDPLNRIGYKKGLIFGLILSAVGALLFIPAASVQSFPLMLTALFVVGLGFTLQQIVANPYVIALGYPATGAHRVNLAGGINSFGTMIGPLLISYLIFGSISGNAVVDLGIDAVKLPYTILAGAFLVFAAILFFSKLPPVTNAEPVEKDLGAFRYPQLALGMIAIFTYVGVEVAIQSNIVALIKLPEIKGLDNTQSVHFISLYWGSLMIGRWAGAVSVFNFSKAAKNIMTIVVPLAAYATILLVNYIKGSPMNDLLYYFPFVLMFIGVFFLTKGKPTWMMLLFGSMGAVMMIVGLLTTGSTALYSFLSGGLFCSVMWPCIFSLSIAGLGKYTNQGSSLLIMMILGGGLIPPLQGLLADNIGIHLSYIVPVFCFAYLAFYGWKVKNVLKSQGIDYDSSVSFGH